MRYDPQKFEGRIPSKYHDHWRTEIFGLEWTKDTRWWRIWPVGPADGKSWILWLSHFQGNGKETRDRDRGQGGRSLHWRREVGLSFAEETQTSEKDPAYGRSNLSGITPAQLRRSCKGIAVILPKPLVRCWGPLRGCLVCKKDNHEASRRFQDRARDYLRHCWISLTGVEREYCAEKERWRKLMHNGTTEADSRYSRSWRGQLDPLGDWSGLLPSLRAYIQMIILGPECREKRGVVSKLCWGAIPTYELESLASWALASSVGPDCVIIQERTDSWDGKVHRGDNRTNFAWNRNRNERGNRKRNQDHIRNQLQQRGCQWIFQPPKASHASGVDRGKAHPQYSYRLTAILGNGLVDEEAMATSLTYRSWVNFESETSLRNLGWLQWSRATDAQSPTAAEAGASTLNGYFRQGSPVFTEKVETNKNEFWRRLIKGYAPVLQERQTRCKLCRNAEVGDLMLVVEEWLPCGQWDWGRIAEVIPGRDGLVQKFGSETKSTTLAGPVFRSFVCWRKRVTFSSGYERNSQPSWRPNIRYSLELWLRTPGLTMVCCTCFACGDGARPGH